MQGGAVGRLAGALALSATLALAALGAAAARAASVAPEAVEGFPSCHDLDEKLRGFSVELRAGTFTESDGTVSVTVSDYDGTTFDWTSDAGLDAVVVQGGDEGDRANVYAYDEATADSDLRGPGEHPQTFHAAFCYDLEGTPSPTPTPTVSPTVVTPPAETPTPGTTTGPTAGTTSGPTGGSTVLGRRFLPATGAGVVPLALVGVGLVGLGAALSARAAVRGERRG
jgi:hypothetical protein